MIRSIFRYDQAYRGLCERTRQASLHANLQDWQDMSFAAYLPWVGITIYLRQPASTMNQFLTHGAISWPELLTDDPGAAVAFYEAVFGWTSDVVSLPMGDYRIGKVGGYGLCGIMKKPQTQMPNTWMFYITVDDVGSTLARVLELGGEVMVQPMVVPSIGTLAGFRDPQGAAIMLITYDPTDVENRNPEIDFSKLASLPGAFSWFDLRTRDPQTACEFYSSLFGWSIRADTTGADAYYMVSIGDVGIGGIIRLRSPDIPPNWTGYVTVSDADDTTKRVLHRGGQILTSPFDVEHVGRVSVVQDPQGAIFSIMQYFSR